MYRRKGEYRGRVLSDLGVLMDRVRITSALTLRVPAGSEAPQTGQEVEVTIDSYGMGRISL